MTKSHVGKEATSEETASMIEFLENVGRILQPLDLANTTTGLPKAVITDKERITRFLLLVSFLDQQAESPTARLTAVNIYKTFGEDLFFKPQSVIVKMDELTPLKDGYKVSPAIGRVLPRFGWIVLRVGGFLAYEMMLGERNLSEELGNCETPQDTIRFLHSNSVVESILREKE